MKKFQKLFALFVVVLMVGGLMAACQTQEEEVGTPFTIGISNPFITSEYRTQMIDELIETNAEYMEKGLTNELVIESFNTDVAGQIEQIENLMNQGVDAILVNPGDAVALNSILEEAVQAGILVLSIDQEIEAEGVINVGHDQYEWAQISAEWFAEKLQTGDVVLIEGFIGHPANELRMSAVYDARRLRYQRSGQRIWFLGRGHRPASYVQLPGSLSEPEWLLDPRWYGHWRSRSCDRCQS